MARRNSDDESSDVLVAEPEHSAEHPQGGKSPSSKKHPGRGVDETEALKMEASRFQQIADHVSTAVMVVDRDFVVTYLNEASKQLFSKNAAEFRKIWPRLDDRHILGTCIDIFHKDPAFQRRLLADPRNLPHRADILVGPLKISLCVNGVFDLTGQYIGNILEWNDVTGLRNLQ